MNCKDINPVQLALTPAERRNLTDFTREIELEAAMCAWEAVYSANQGPWEGGAAQQRYCCGSLAQALHVGYCIANVDDQLDGYAYDWEFVPWFIETCVIWDTADAYIHGTPLLVDDWVERCRRPDFLPEPEPSDEDLLKECRNLLNHIANQAGSYDLAAKLDRRLKK